MTHKDSGAFFLHIAQGLIEQLSSTEHEIETTRPKRDTQLRKQAERQRQQLLEQQDASNIYLYLLATGIADNESFRTEWQKRSRRVNVSAQLQQWGVKEFFSEYWIQPVVDLTPLPAYSFILTFTFSLAQPYLSKDDNPFYIIDNPIARDKVFRLPLVRPSSWKGSLRAALWHLGHRHDGEQHRDEPIQRMFGEIRNDGAGQAGRLYFYPTFFTRTDLEIINPHDRTRRVGKNPILFECVPIETTGRFTLLYVPFDRVGKCPIETARQIVLDLKLLCSGLQAMFCLYGFGAKTSSGFGTGTDLLVGQGTLQLKAIDPSPMVQESASEPSPDLPRYLSAPEQLHPDLQAADGGLKSKAEYQSLIESRGQKYAKKDRQLYNKAKSWWEREGRTLATATPAEEAEEQPTPAMTERHFDRLGEMVQVITTLAEAFTKKAGGAA